MTIRIEQTKDGVYKLHVNGAEMTMPTPGQSIVLAPKSPPEYAVRIENSSDVRS